MRFLKFLAIQLKLDLREKGSLVNFYIVPLLFYLIIGGVFSNMDPHSQSLLAGTMIIFAITMGTVNGIPGPIVKMRESGTLLAYSINGISVNISLCIQAVSAFIHILIVCLIIYFTSPVLFGSGHRVNPLFFFFILLLFLLISTIIGVYIGLIAKNHSFAVTLSQLIFLPSLLLSGIMFDISLLPRPLMELGRLFPATYAMQLFIGKAFQQHTECNLQKSLTILLFIGIVLFLLTLGRIQKISREERI